MRVPINLSSQPFRRARAPMAAALAASGLLLALLGGQIALTLSQRAQVADVRRSVEQLNRQLRERVAEQARLTAALNKPQNAEVLERVVFINTLLRRKGVSWTRIFSDLEKVLPYNVKVIQINPTIDSRSQVALDMMVASEAVESQVAFLRALEESPLFGEVQQPSSFPPSQGEPLNRYRVLVRYAPKP